MKMREVQIKERISIIKSFDESLGKVVKTTITAQENPAIIECEDKVVEEGNKACTPLVFNPSKVKLYFSLKLLSQQG